MRWHEVVAAQPDLARGARAFFDIANHKVLGTVRPDGSPRVSAIEARFVDDDLWFASMAGSPKSRDLLGDPRFDLHSPSAEPDVWIGDAKLAGRAELVVDPAARARLVEAAGTAPPGDFDLFRLRVEHVVVVRLGDPPDHLVITSWRPGHRVRVTRAGEPS